MTTIVEEKNHAVLGPSGWHTWSACPGSIPLSEGIVEQTSRYAKEGTAAHSLFETCLLEGFNAEDLLGKTYEVEGDTFTVDMEMADAVNEALNYIAQLVDPEKGDILMAEQAVPIGHLTGETDAEGTSDVVAIIDEGKTLVVADLKYGKGVQVWASDLPMTDEPSRPNGQLAMYALGTLEKFGLVYDGIERVKLVVLQPRIEHFDEHDMTVEELLAFGEEVTIAAGRTQLPDAIEDLHPGEKQCKFCKAKHICPALKESVSQSLALISPAEPADFEDLTLPKKAASLQVDPDVSGEKLAEFMRAVPLIEEAIKAARAELERRLFDGQQVPGFYLGVGKMGNRMWKDEEQAAEELTKSGRLPASEAYVKKPISPTQAEKKLKSRPKVWSKLAPLITQAPGKPSVCREGDKNPPYQIGSTADDFENLETSVSDAPALSVDDLMA